VHKKDRKQNDIHTKGDYMSKVSFMTKNFHRYDPMSIESYLAIGGFNALKKAVTMDGEDIASLLSEAQIKGRGGAAYPMGRKWSQARAVKGEHKVIICNADEGEPCTFKDRELITNDPFNLIEAMTIGAWSIRAQDGYIYLREEYAHLRSRLKNAIEEAERCGFLGKNILGKEDFDFHIHLRSGAGAYVCGEGTALIRSIEGKAGRPRMKPPFIKQSGLFALPTCVNNVESLSIVPHLLLDDKKEYISYGSGESLGTKLVSVGGNVSAVNLLNIKKVGRRRNNMQWFKVPAKIYFERDSIQYLQDMKDCEKVMIVTDRSMVDLGFVDKVTHQLHQRKNKVTIQLFTDVEADPSVQTVYKGTDLMRSFQPDTIIALGGGSPMDAAKAMWLFYEQPQVDFEDLVQKFMDIRKRAFRFPELGRKAKFIGIPTTSGTGSEVTPFTVISDGDKKYPIADYSLTPTIAIVDPAFTMTVPAGVTADTGLDVLTHAVEAYVSVLANDFTDGLALQAIKLVFQYLERSYKHGASDPEAREHMHNASTIAGMAFSNAFLGINHSMAHKIGGKYHVPHGRANAILLPHVIRYNGTRPQKTATWPKYNYYKADLKYQEIARTLGLPCATPAEGVESFARACHELAVNVGIKMSFKEQGIDEKTFIDGRKELAMLSFEDQCTPANPRLALVADMEEILTKAYYGE